MIEELLGRRGDPSARDSLSALVTREGLEWAVALAHFFCSVDEVARCGGPILTREKTVKEPNPT